LSDRDSLLASKKTEVRAQLQQELLQVAQDCAFEVLLAVSILQSEKVQQVRIAEDQIRADAILIAQSRQLFAGQVAWFSADRRSLVEHALNLALERPGAPPLKPAHLSVELALKRVRKIDNLSEVRPGQLSTQRVDNLSIWKSLGKADHVEKIGAAESAAIFFTQSSTQRVDNLLAVSGAFGGENILADPFTNRPVEGDHLRVDGRSRTDTGTLDEQPDVAQ